MNFSLGGYDEIKLVIPYNWFFLLWDSTCDLNLQTWIFCDWWRDISFQYCHSHYWELVGKACNLGT